MLPGLIGKILKCIMSKDIHTRNLTIRVYNLLDKCKVLALDWNKRHSSPTTLNYLFEHTCIREVCVAKL